MTISVAANDTEAAPRPKIAGNEIAKAARYTLLSIDRHRSVGQLALRYDHVGDPETDHIAYAYGSKCYYGRRFLELDRFQQAFVVFHETFHHVLGHLQLGALLAKREGSGFNGLAFNIAADAIINHIAEGLPDADRIGSTLRHGVRKCHEFGIVQWAKVVSEAVAVSAEIGVSLDPVWTKQADELSTQDIYFALKRLAFSAKNNPAWMARNTAGAIQRIGDAVDAHDDLSEAIKQEASRKSEGDLLNDISRGEDQLRQMQAGAQPGDAIFRVKRPDGATHTPWPQAMRTLANRALLTRPTTNPFKPARGVLSQVGMRANPIMPSAIRNSGVAYRSRMGWQRPAKKCVTIIDTSISMLQDRELLTKCIKEVASICKRVDTSQTVIFADAAVAEVVNVADCEAKILGLVPKGGGGTDFRPAIELAETMNPDLIVYLTDLCGRFPEKSPKCPIIWGFPPEYAEQKTPYGLRLPLHP